MRFLSTVKGDIENIFNLSEEQLKSRTVQHYDVCDAYKSEIIPDNEVFKYTFYFQSLEYLQVLFPAH